MTLDRLYREAIVLIARDVPPDLLPHWVAARLDVKFAAELFGVAPDYLANQVLAAAEAIAVERDLKQAAADSC